MHGWFVTIFLHSLLKKTSNLLNYYIFVALILQIVSHTDVPATESRRSCFFETYAPGPSHVGIFRKQLIYSGRVSRCHNHQHDKLVLEAKIFRSSNCILIEKIERIAENLRS
jgi:hypothetical protein